MGIDLEIENSALHADLDEARWSLDVLKGRMLEINRIAESDEIRMLSSGDFEAAHRRIDLEALREARNELLAFQSHILNLTLWANPDDAPEDIRGEMNSPVWAHFRKLVDERMILLVDRIDTLERELEIWF